MGLFLKNNHLLVCWNCLFLVNWIGTLALYQLLKLPPKKIGALVRSMKFLSSEAALYLNKFTFRPSMEHYCHVWVGAPSCYLDVLYKLQRRTVGFSLGASLEPLAHRRNVASLSLFYRHYFGRCSSKLAELVPLLYSSGRLTSYCNRLHSFSVTIPGCYKVIYVNSFFPPTARLWNSLPVECFTLIYNLNGLNFGVWGYRE